jgi:NAD(P)-dependent dehydrogenase (short-subunit alcohol dehydrogenase family)
MRPVAEKWSDTLQRVLGSLRPETPGKAFCNVTAAPYTSRGEIVDQLSQQIAKPVRWAEICAQLLRAGAEMFVEVGPGRVLSDLMIRNLPAGESRVILSADPGESDARHHVVTLLARLASRGVDVRWDVFADTEVTAELRRESATALAGQPALAAARATAAPAPDAGFAAAFFESNCQVIERFFVQQSSLVEATLPQCDRDCQALVQAALAANQKVLAEFLAAQESGLRAVLRSPAPAVPAVPAATIHASKTTVTVSTPGPERSEPQDVPTRIEAALREEISRVTGFPSEALTRESSFNDLGIDSLSMMEIWTQVLGRMPQLAALADSITDIRCLGDVARVYAQQTAGQSNEDTAPVAPESERVSAAALVAPRQPLDPTASWDDVRAHLIQAISDARGIEPERISDTADFEDELGINVFAREELFREPLFAHARFSQAGRELLNARSLGELGELLARYTPLEAQPKSSPVIPLPERAGTDRVERFVLREEPIELQALSASGATELPKRVALFGPAGSELRRRVHDLFADAGAAVATIGLTACGWIIGDTQLPIDAAGDLRHALDQISAGEPHMLVFTPEPFGPATEVLEQTSTALFVLAKAVFSEPDRAGWATALTIVGTASGVGIAEGVRGLARSLSRELPELPVRTFWLTSALKDVSDELLTDGLCSITSEKDIGESNGTLVRSVLDRVGQYGASSGQAEELGPESRILVLGGGDGISAEIGIALAAAYRCNIVAVGRTANPGSLPFADVPPGPEADSLIKRRLFEQLSVGGQVSGELLKRRWNAVARQRAIWTTRARVEAAGGRFSYYSGDVSDAASFRRVIEEVQAGGSLHGVIHGAGMTSDSLLARKTVKEFRAVLQTKAISAALLRELLANEPLKFVFFLSSMSSYAGTAGQTDYAAANEILNGIAHEWNRQSAYPVKSLLWSVWTDAGLAGATLKDQMAKLGLAGISTSDGVALLMNELEYGTKEGDWLLFAPMSTLRYAMQTRSIPVPLDSVATKTEIRRPGVAEGRPAHGVVEGRQATA